MKIVQAQIFATNAHMGQKRRNNGEDYVNHCIRVANTCGLYTENETIIIAAMLHDTLEDTTTTKRELMTLFGVDVCSLVCSLTNDVEEMEKLGGKREYLASRINFLWMHSSSNWPTASTISAILVMMRNHNSIVIRPAMSSWRLCVRLAYPRLIWSYWK